MRVQALEQHRQVLGVLYIVLGAIGLLVATGVFLLLAAPSLFLSEEPALMRGGLLVAVLVAGLLALLSAPGLLAGIGLLMGKRWARPLALVLGILQLFNFPVGTALGVYTIWFVVQSGTDRLFEPREPQRLITP